MLIFITSILHRINLRNKELKNAYKRDVPARILGSLIVNSHNNKPACRQLHCSRILCEYKPCEFEIG